MQRWFEEAGWKMMTMMIYYYLFLFSDIGRTDLFSTSDSILNYHAVGSSTVGFLRLN